MRRKQFKSPRKSQSKQNEGSKARMIVAGKADKLLTKLAFFNGETDRYKLAEIGGCCERTLVDSWLPEFERDRKKLYLSFKNSSLKLGVTDKEFEDHLVYIRQLRSISDNYQNEISNYDDMRKSLSIIVEQLSEHPDFDKKDFKNICSLLQIFVTSKKAYDTTVQNYIKVTNEWAKATGVEAHHSAAAGRLKEAERLRGKDDAGRDPLVDAKEGDNVAKGAADPFFKSK